MLIVVGKYQKTNRCDFALRVKCIELRIDNVGNYWQQWI